MLARFAGSCRWLWNYLLDLQQKKYEAEKKFIFRFEMQELLPELKREYSWLAVAPSNSLQRVCRNLDQALKKCFKEGAGFPRFKKRGVSREAFYVVNQGLRIENSRVVLPKMKQGVKFRAGRLPEGRILSATVSYRAGVWWCVVQCEVEQDILDPDASSLPIKNVIGVDLGLASLMASSDGVVVSNPRRLSKAQKRLRRAQRILARRQKNSANRRRQAARVAVLHAKVADYRSDALHQATTALVRRADVIVTEDLNVQGMLKNKRLSRSISDAGWGEALRQISYKAEWAGKQHIKVGRFEPSTQKCSSCGNIRSGEDRLRLHERTYRCASCGNVADRDFNAALNLRNYGLNYVGQAMPERMGIITPINACGASSAGPDAMAAGRYGALNQEPQMSDSHGRPWIMAQNSLAVRIRVPLEPS
jgi:putative transposase